MKRLLHGLVASAVGLMMAVPLGAFAYTYDEGGFRWYYNIDQDEEDGGWTASIYRVYQLDENGKEKRDEWGNPVSDATTMVVPATLPAVGTNEFARAEAVYDESGAFLSNKYVTVYGPEVKSVVAAVTYLYASQWGNDKLTSVTIPETVEYVGGFGGCENLATVIMGPETEFTCASFAETPWLKAQGEFVIRDDVLIAYQGSATSVVVPDGITEIGDSAFSAWYNDDMTNLTSVTLPASLKRIDDYAFDGCRALTSIALPADLRYIGDGAFYKCEGLTSIAIPGKVKHLNGEAFYCCTGLVSVALSDGLESIGYGAFCGTGLAAIDIPASVEEIEDEAFADCARLATVTGCAGLEYVGSDAFYGTAIYDNINDAIIQVGPVVIGYKGTLPETLTIPEGVTQIGYGAFYGANIKTVNLPSTLRRIADGAFRWSDLENVTGGSGVGEVGYSAFSGTPYSGTFYSDRGNKDKPFALMRLGGVVLGYTGVCPAEIVIPDDVTCLAESLFDNDYDDTTTNIISVVVGSGVKSIQDYAFWEAKNLKSVTVLGVLEDFGESVFEGCTGLTDVTLTCSHLSFEDQFSGCKSLANVTINLVEPEQDGEYDEPYLTIGTFAFMDCNNLSSVKVKRPGFQLIGWRTWGVLKEEIVFADELGTFALRSVRRDGAGNPYYSYVNICPKWKRILRSTESDAPFTAAVASTYLGWLTDVDGNLVASVSVTIKKAKKGMTTTTATVKVDVLGGKKLTLKGDVDENGNGQGDLAGLVLTANGLAGTLSVNGVAYAADGARDVAKTAKDPEQSVLSALNKKVWTLVLVPTDEILPAFANGYAGFSVSMGTKGKAKLTGTLPDGTKLNLTAQTIVGEYNCCIPFVYSKPKATVGFLVWIGRDGAAVDVTSVSEWKCKPTGSNPFVVKMGLEDFGALEAIPASTAFHMDPDDIPATLVGVQTAFLPTAEPVAVALNKWTLAKAATIKYKKGVFDQDAYDKGVAQGKTNNSALKLKNTAKSGLFSGSFTIFTLNETSMKKVTANVNGVVCNGVGYGSAVIKKQGVMPVVIGEIVEEDEEY